MKTERLICPAKLTLSLSVEGRRSDGYHFIDAEMVSVDLCDEMFIKDACQNSFVFLEGFALNRSFWTNFAHFVSKTDVLA